MKGLSDARIALVTLYVAGFCGYASSAVLFPVISPYAKELGASDFEAGLISAAYAYVTALTMVPFGALSDKVGRKSLLIVGLLTYAIAPLFYGFADNAFELLLVRLFHGVALATFIPAANALVLDLSKPERRGETLGWLAASTQLGFVAGPVIGGLMKQNYGISATFYSCSIVSLPGLMLILVGSRWINKAPFTSSRPAEGRYWGWVKNRMAVGALFAPLFATFGAGAVASFALPLYAAGFGIDPVAVGFMIATLYTGSAIVRAPSGRLSDRIGRRPVILSGLIVEAIAISFTSISRSLPSLMATAILCGLGVGFTNPTGFALLSDVVPTASRGIAMGVANSFLQAGLAVGSTSMGFVKGMFGFEWMFQTCALVIVLGSALIFMLTGKRHHSLN